MEQDDIYNPRYLPDPDCLVCKCFDQGTIMRAHRQEKCVICKRPIGQHDLVHPHVGLTSTTGGGTVLKKFMEKTDCQGFCFLRPVTDKDRRAALRSLEVILNATDRSGD